MTANSRMPLSFGMFTPPSLSASAPEREDAPIAAAMQAARRHSLSSSGRRASTGDLLHSSHSLHQTQKLAVQHKAPHKRARSPMRKSLNPAPDTSETRARSPSNSRFFGRSRRNTSSHQQQHQQQQQPATSRRPVRPRGQSRPHYSKQQERRLSQYLMSTVKRTKFKSFLRKQFSHENLMFVERANNFRDQCLKRVKHGGFPTTVARNTAALELYFEFMTPESPHEVHVDSFRREDLENALKEAVPNFDEIYKWQTASGVKRLSDAPIHITAGPIDASAFSHIRDAIWSCIEQDAFQRYLGRLSQRQKKK